MWLEKITIFLLIFLAPLFFGAVHTWSAMLLAAILYSSFLFSSRSLKSLWTLPRWILILLGTLLAFSIFRAYFYVEDSFSVYYQLTLWGAFFCGALLIQNFNLSTLRWVALAFLSLGFFESLYSLWQVSQVEEWVLWQKKSQHLDYFTGSYFNRNHLAGLLQLCFGFGFALSLESGMQKQYSRFLIFISMTFFILIGILNTGSRMGTCSLSFALVVFSLLLMANSKVEVRWKCIFLGLLITAGLLVFIFFPMSAAERFETALSSEMQDWDGGRMIAWQDGWRLFQDHMLWGVGLGNFEWKFPTYQAGSLMRGWDHLHNDYLELLAELGILGFVLWLGAFFYFIAKIFSKIFSYSKNHFILIWGGGLGFLSFAIHGIGDFNFAIPANAFLSIVCLGVIYRLSQLEPNAEHTGLNEK